MTRFEDLRRGVGMFIGTWFSGFITEHYTVNGHENWLKIWLVPAYIAVAVLIYFILLFKEKREIEVAGRKTLGNEL